MGRMHLGSLVSRSRGAKLSPCWGSQTPLLPKHKALACRDIFLLSSCCAWGERHSLTPRLPVRSTAAPADGECPEECKSTLAVLLRSQLWSGPHPQPSKWCCPRCSSSFIFQQPVQLLQLKCSDSFSKH